MIKQNLHTHSSFSDGKASMEAMTLSALNKGFKSLGFSEHAYAPYDPDCCMKKDAIPDYIAEFDRLKQKYSGQIELLIGLECDSYYQTEKCGLDYTIGSKHYVFDENTGEYLTIDYLYEIFEKAIDNVGGGSVERLVKLYYDDLTRFIFEYKPDIAGHVDIIGKLNGENRYFNPESAWYRRTVDDAAEKLAQSGCIVEVNTGGIFRGKKTEPYPSTYFLSRLFALKVPVTISSDAHSVDSLDFWFDEAAALLKKTGYRSIKQLTADGFTDVELDS